MDISFAIPVCNEHEELHRLLEQLVWNTPVSDEIVVLCDDGNTTPEVESVLHEYVVQINDPLTNRISVHKHPLNNDFATQKNYLTSKCTKDWVFLIDADETLSDYLLENVGAILDMNSEVEAFAVPRVNTVIGLTPEDRVKWHWKLNEWNWINWPDYQWRLYRNKPEIRWTKPVHEQLIGFETYAPLPADKDFALYHKKHIERQRRQNDYYDTLG